jgi:hypothetical protein
VTTRVVAFPANRWIFAIERPASAITTYAVTGAPFVETGGDQLTAAFPLRGRPEIFRGAVGAPTTIGAVVVDGAPVPAAERAATLNAYDLPFNSPATICVVARDLNTRGVPDAPPRTGVTT